MHLVMVPNPPFHPAGDFALDAAGHLHARDAAVPGATVLTFGSIGLYDMRLFAHIEAGTRMAMSPLYRDTIAAGRATGERFDGRWENIGTPAQLAALDAQLRGRPEAPNGAKRGGDAPPALESA
jgi:MurNAc alpha-1-phosphate uridylyltransferase